MLDQFIVQSEHERSGIRQELELVLVEKTELEKAVEILQHETVRDKEERVRMLNEVPPLSLLRPRSAADCVLWWLTAWPIWCSGRYPPSHPTVYAAPYDTIFSGMHPHSSRTKAIRRFSRLSVQPREGVSPACAPAPCPTYTHMDRAPSHAYRNVLVLPDAAVIRMQPHAMQPLSPVLAASKCSPTHCTTT